MAKRRRVKAKAKAKAKSKIDGVNNQTTLPIEFRDKTLYLCGVEFDLSFASRIKIHAIDLVELLTSSSSSPSKCRVVSFLGPKDLRSGPGSVSCGACGVSGGSKKEKPEWRRVDTIGPFPFVGRAFAVDLPDHPSKKLLFTDRHGSPKLAVYLMSLEENEESLCEIAEMNLSEMNLPFVLHKMYPRDLHFFHLGGNNVCFVASCFWDSEYHEHVDEPPKSYLMRGAAVTFQFEFDISKVGMKDCFTVQFQPPRFFEYHTSSDCTSGLAPSSCFLL